MTIKLPIAQTTHISQTVPTTRHAYFDWAVSFALEKQPYDPLEAFTHIAMVGAAPCVVMANPSSGLRAVADVENQARKSGQQTTPAAFTKYVREQVTALAPTVKASGVKL